MAVPDDHHKGVAAANDDGARADVGPVAPAGRGVAVAGIIVGRALAPLGKGRP
jgi:hypothetical protein